MKLTVGTPFIDDWNGENADAIELSDGQQVISRFPLSELNEPGLGRISAYTRGIDHLVLGFSELTDVEFLRELPYLTDIWIISSSMKNINGLRHCANVTSLAIDRPTCRIDVLSELNSLCNLYLDGWKPGAESISRLTSLQRVGIQRFGEVDLRLMAHWGNLRELWINAGKLADLTGIPDGIQRLRLTSLRHLSSLKPLSQCTKIERLEIDGCRQVHSLAGIESCQQLQILSITQTGELESLDPLAEHMELQYLFIADGSTVSIGGTEALYRLKSLRTLIINRQTGVDIDRLKKALPNCDVQLTRK